MEGPQQPDLELRLRYQFDGVPFEKGGNFSNLFANPDSAGPFDLTSLVRVPGRQMYNDDYKDIEPRFGFAWDPFKDGKTSIRGGTESSTTASSTTCLATRAPIRHSRERFRICSATPPHPRRKQFRFPNTTPPGTHFVDGDFETLTLLDPHIQDARQPKLELRHSAQTARRLLYSRRTTSVLTRPT